ncbi:MAG: cytidylate kinase-like family protein, partial [Bacteroidales bacterium]|nr:cytidylate kinase-like family protein [Bacteroidales bacterium]
MSTIITIGRSFGSGGGYIGQAIGKKLGIPVYDNELISKVAEESGYSKSLFADGEEKRSLFSMSSFFSSGRMGYIDSGYVNDNVMFKIQSEVIRGIALKGDAVIIGRCADYILRDMKCLNVF